MVFFDLQWFPVVVCTFGCSGKFGFNQTKKMYKNLNKHTC